MRIREPYGCDVILYDGDCGACNSFISFVCARNAAFRMASIQGEVAREILNRHGKDAERLETMYVVTGYLSGHERCLDRSAAVLYCLERLDSVIWRNLGWSLGRLPVSLLNVVYDRGRSYRNRFPVRCDIGISTRSLDLTCSGEENVRGSRR